MTSDTIPVLTPPREITEASLEVFEEQLEPHLAAEGPGVVLDLAEVEFIGSSGLGAMVKAGMRLDRRGGRLALACPNKTIENVLKLIGLESKLPVFRSVDAASGFIADHGKT